MIKLKDCNKLRTKKCRGSQPTKKVVGVGYVKERYKVKEGDRAEDAGGRRRRGDAGRQRGHMRWTDPPPLPFPHRPTTNHSRCSISTSITCGNKNLTQRRIIFAPFTPTTHTRFQAPCFSLTLTHRTLILLVDHRQMRGDVYISYIGICCIGFCTQVH